MTEARIIDGKALAARLRAHTARQVAALAAAGGPTPGLAVVLVGEDAASEVYVRNKGRAAEAAGMASVSRRLHASASTGDVLAEVAGLNADRAVHGILVQLPLPPQVDAGAVTEAVDPAKDVDGFHPLNAGRLLAGRPTLVPCTPRGCMALLDEALGELAGAEALVIGRSTIVGKPMALLLLAANCTVTLAHSRTRDLPAVCRRADILVAAVGRPEMVRGDWIKPGAAVIDVGVNRVAAADGSARLVGDVAFAEALKVAGAITPVPGGVGPMTIAMLLSNTLQAACAQAGVAVPAPAD